MTHNLRATSARNKDRSMVLTYDPDYNVADLKLRERNEEFTTLTISDELNIDIAPDGAVYGIEFMNANEQLSAPHSGLLEIINQVSGESAKVKLTG